MMREILVGACVMVSGCQSMQTAMQYEPTVHLVEMDDDTYRVFEHPNRDRVMTTPSMSKTMKRGLVEGVTFGGGNLETPQKRHEAAARRYLDSTNRQGCTITKGSLLVDPQYEFFFECSDPSKPARP